MNSTPHDEAILDGLMGKRLLEWKLIEDQGVFLTLSDGTVIACYGVGVLFPVNTTLQ